MVALLTRVRANKDHIHGELAETYYAQSSSVSAWIIQDLIQDIRGHFFRSSSIWIRGSYTVSAHGPDIRVRNTLFVMLPEILMRSLRHMYAGSAPYFHDLD
jgi:hypothetical protein